MKSFLEICERERDRTFNQRLNKEFTPTVLSPTRRTVLAVYFAARGAD
jgi:hypothetical protein